MIRDSNLHLAQIGHRRICTLAYFSCEHAKERIRGLLEQDMKALGVDFHPSYNLPCIQDDTQSLWEMLENLFSITPPTALIATETTQLITIYSYCMLNQLTIPNDLSLIVTQNSPNLEWFRPSPAFFEYHTDKYIKQIHSWIENYPSSDIDPVLLPSTFSQGASLKAIPS
ncbi:substrate-binding domain-containing protein [Oceaniferula marina]|uniref:substrate-binding domain-containing protein n=1 Tax=Oceaniferula marina TaxID=2748318 RepID=UPI001D0499EC|nr:substrate-binding domain-containing protein [Oceaniferula marina]